MNQKNSNSATTRLPQDKHQLGLKVCGMKFPNNIVDIAKLQPDYLGFIFYEKSSRFFDGNLPKLPENIKKVGVFVNAPLRDIVKKVAQYNLNMIQLHGNESPQFCQDLNHYFASYPDKPIEIIKVFSVKNHFNFNQLVPYETVCDYFLFDTKGPLPGGNGYTFDWTVLKHYPSTKPYFLSGGIGLDQAESIKTFLKKPESDHCMAIDVNSKFELQPGLKNAQLLNQFINIVKPNPTDSNISLNP